MSKMVARLVPHYEFDIDDFFRSDGAPDDVALQRQDGFFRLARLYEQRFAKGRQMTAEAAEQHLRPAVHRKLPGAVPVQPAGARKSRRRRLHAVVVRRHRHRSRRQCLLRPHRLLRRQHLRQRLLQGVHRRGREARPCARARARPLSSRHHRQCAAAARDLRARRSLVPHVRHRSRDAGGAAGALSHPALASGALLRRLSRLVGRRAARRRQSGVAARDLYAGGHVGEDAARAAHAQGHRLRAGQSAAGAASERQRARRFRAGRQFAQSGTSTARPMPHG